MKERRLKNIPIVDQDGRPLGVLNARDALEALLEEVEYEEILLREYGCASVTTDCTRPRQYGRAPSGRTSQQYTGGSISFTKHRGAFK